MGTTNKIRPIRKELKENVKQYNREQKLLKRQKAEEVFEQILSEARTLSKDGITNMTIDQYFGVTIARPGEDAKCVDNDLKKALIRLCRRRLGRVRSFRYHKKEKTLHYRLIWDNRLWL